MRLNGPEHTVLKIHSASYDHLAQVFKLGLLTLLAFTAVLLAATFGLTWAVVAALKDTRVRQGKEVAGTCNLAQQRGYGADSKMPATC